MRAETKELAGVRQQGQGFRLGRGQIAIVVVAFLMSVAVGYAGYRQLGAPAAPAVAGTTVPVRRGTLAATVSTSGSVAANRQARLAFNTSGRLKELSVNLGDVVAVGQVLAKLDTTSQELKLAQTQSQLQVAKIKLVQTTEGARPEEVEAAKAQLQSALAKVADLTGGPTAAEVKSAEQAIVAAQAQVTKAENDLARLEAGPDADAIKLVEQDVEKAKSSLWSSQTSRDGTCGNPRNAAFQCEAANASVMGAEVSLQQAQTRLAQAKGPAKPDDLETAQKNVASARAGVASAQARLDQLRAGPNAADLKSAQSAVASARSQLALKSGASPLDVSLLEEQVKQADISVKQAKVDLDNAILVAPFGGTIAAITGSVGELIGSNAQVVTIVDTGSVRVDTSVDETDVAKLKVGQPAQISFDALPGRTLAGRVSAVSLAGTSQQGVVTYLASIAVDDTQGLALATGMTANVAITTEQRDNVLLVPNRAVRVQGRSRVVQVVVDGQPPQSRPVRIGLANDQFTEVVEGLQEGDTALIPTTTTAQPKPGPGFGAGFGGGPVPVAAPVAAPKPTGR